MTPLGASGPGREVKVVTLIKTETILKESVGRHLLYEEWDCAKGHIEPST